MIYCLDTDILIEHFRGNKGIKERIERLTADDKLGLIWLTVYEFFKGIFISGKFQEEKYLQKLVSSVQLIPYGLSQHMTQHWSRKNGRRTLKGDEESHEMRGLPKSDV